MWINQDEFNKIVNDEITLDDLMKNQLLGELISKLQKQLDNKNIDFKKLKMKKVVSLNNILSMLLIKRPITTEDLENMKNTFDYNYLPIIQSNPKLNIINNNKDEEEFIKNMIKLYDVINTK